MIAEEVKAAGAMITTEAVQEDRVALSSLQKFGFTPVSLASPVLQGFRAMATPGWAVLDGLQILS